MDMGKTQLSSCALHVLGVMVMSVHCKADDVYLVQHHTWLRGLPQTSTDTTARLPCL